MRRVISGTGADTTQATVDYLLTGNEFRMAELYLIGEPGHPKSLLLTDWEAPISWRMQGTFKPAVIKRSNITTKIGLEVGTLEIDWSPPVTPLAQTIIDASPYQLAQMGYYDNWPVRVWTVYMSRPGDGDTYGASELWGGRIGQISVKRGLLHLTVNSFLDVINQQVPNNVIEFTNTYSAYVGANVPASLLIKAIPQFDVIAGSTPSVLIADCTYPEPHHLFLVDGQDNELRGGYLVFNWVDGNTLGGVWSPIFANRKITVGGIDYNEIALYNSLPWPPKPGVDTFYLSRAMPIDKSQLTPGHTEIEGVPPHQRKVVVGDYFGFPYMPAPWESQIT